MQKKYYWSLVSSIIVCAIAFFLLRCDTGVEVSPAPGILRVTLQSEPTDTAIVVIDDTLTVSAGDSFGVTISQGKVYSGDNFAVLFIDINSDKIEALYNVLAREIGEYKKYTIYESYVPPANYNMLQFVANAKSIKLKYFRVPVQLPEASNPLLDFKYDFQVLENKTTEINVQISPFKSVVRYRDSYYFTRDMRITGVQYYRACFLLVFFSRQTI